MEETEEQKVAREAEEAAEAKAAEEAAAKEAEEKAAKEAEEAAAAEKKPETVEEVSVQIGEEKPPAEEKAPGWVREVRQRNRELEKQNRDLQRQIQGQQQTQVGKEPQMSDPEIDYDADKYKKAYGEWHERKAKAEGEQKKAQEQQQREQQAWQGKLDNYGAKKAELKLPDMDDAEALVQETLSERQQAIIVKGAKNPALVVYALGRNPGKLKELAGIGDLVEFAFAVANVEGQLKITKKAVPPAPERKVEGSGAKGGAVDSALDRLREEAERTGDYSKVMAHKRKKAA